MEIIALFFVELFILFLLSRVLQKRLSHFFYLLTRSVRWTVYGLALIFLPGTIIHEIAHYLMAHILFVHTGKMEFLPKVEGESVKLGSVAIAKVDPFRRLLIGVAPFLVGTSIILLALFIAERNTIWQLPWATALILYILFEVGNSMFSSKKDLEGALLVVVCITVVSVVLYLLGLRISLHELKQLISDSTIHIFYQGVIYLTIPLLLDTVLIFILSISNRLLSRR